MHQKNSTDDHECTNFTTNVLILSDRLYEHALTLANFIQNHTNIHVIGIAKNIDEIISLAQNENVDFLIIAGYLEDSRSYDAIKKLKKNAKKKVYISSLGHTGRDNYLLLPQV